MIHGVSLLAETEVQDSAAIRLNIDGESHHVAEVRFAAGQREQGLKSSLDGCKVGCGQLGCGGDGLGGNGDCHNVGVGDSLSVSVIPSSSMLERAMG